jgi:CubicO group peptidase (beta-lactamase class C family)/predicted aspartyl protease
MACMRLVGKIGRSSVCWRRSARVASVLAVATLVGSLLAACAGAASGGQRPSEAPRRLPSVPAKTELTGTVTVPLVPMRHFLAVTARINGKGPFRLVIDTGAADVMRVSARLAKALDLARVGTVRSGDPSGKHAVNVPVVRVASVAIGAARFSGIEASVGARLGSLQPDGIVGLALFWRLTATLDYSKQQLRLSHKPLPLGGAHVIEFSTNRGVPQIEINAAGTTLRADVDTGSPALVTVPSSTAVPLRGEPRVVGEGRTATNEFEIRAAELAGDLDVAGWSHPNPTIDIVDLFPVASVGSRLLRQYVVTFDLPRKRLALERRGLDELSRADTRRPESTNWRGFAAWLAKRAAGGKFAGAVLIARDGKPVVKQACGLADRERRLANTVDTRFNIGSLGKTFTAVAIAQLVEVGKLSFDDPIGKYLSSFPREVADQITIGQLLTHTSGLGDVFMRWHPTAPAQLDVSEVMTRIVREPIRFEPGSRFAYSNSGYVVLGAVIEAVSGQDYFDYVRAHVFKPAGMTRTGWYALGEVPNMAHGYARVDTSRAWVAGNPSGGVYSTVGDLLKFAKALLSNKLLRPEMTTTVLAGKVDTPRPGPAKTRYGYGFEEEVRSGVRIVGNGGGQPGIEAQLRIFPERGYTVIVLTNQEGANRPVLERAVRLAIGVRRRP